MFTLESNTCVVEYCSCQTVPASSPREKGFHAVRVSGKHRYFCEASYLLHCGSPCDPDHCELLLQGNIFP